MACIECDKRLTWDRSTPTCPLCGCLQPDTDPVDCDICHHTGCHGCVSDEDGLCMTCRDIEKERRT